jgi:hypothetical protein
MAMVRMIYKGGVPFIKPGIVFKGESGITANAGAPTSGTSGTGAGRFGKGSLLLDTTNGNVYINTNTMASPTWLLVAGGTGVSAFSSTDAISAAGSNQGGATALTTTVNFVTTVASGSGVSLPAAVAGSLCVVYNKGANVLQVYGAGTDTINGVTTTTGVPLGTFAEGIFFCETSGPAGNWQINPLFLEGYTPVALGTAAPAINPHAPHTYVFNRAGVVAATIAAPTAGLPGTGDDGTEITFTSDSANAHTVTFTGGTLDSGGAATALATFNPNKGATLTIMAFNARWKVMSANGVSFS